MPRSHARSSVASSSGDTPSPPPSCSRRRRRHGSNSGTDRPRSRPPFLGVEREARDQVAREPRAACRVSAATMRSASNAGSPTTSPASAASVIADISRQPRRRVVDRGHAVAVILPVGDIVAARGTRHRAATPARASAGRTTGWPRRSSSTRARSTRARSRRSRRARVSGVGSPSTPIDRRQNAASPHKIRLAAQSLADRLRRRMRAPSCASSPSSVVVDDQQVAGAAAAGSRPRAIFAQNAIRWS